MAANTSNRASRPVDLFLDLLANERTSGILLVLCTAVSLVLTNSALGHGYVSFWHTQLAGGSVEHWINDGLMAIFFLMVGLELEREVYIGELSNRKLAMLPAIAALGGMLVPAGIHLLFNHGTPTASGAGIPMATDIAFAIGILSLLGNRVPLALKVFLTALAVIDDLGAIFTIAIFYSSGIQWAYLGGALGIFAVLLLLNRLKVHVLLPYLLLGAVMWWLMLHSGVHATITGVLVAFAIPFGDGSSSSISWKLQHFLHKPVSFIILPLFALANTCLPLGADWYGHLMNDNSYGIFLGLVLGKPVGITLFCAIAIGLGICAMPAGISWKQLIGAGILGGIGFTMSIFIAMLAFDDAEHILSSKTTILLSSTVAAIIGYAWLHVALPRRGADRNSTQRMA
ncbi:MAG: Na+/H+ antiporter NhaA [Flavobacteriales bacterium]|nr:Na+/H+ antiporter NhaA [Flavobacteriales bacterium]